MSDDLKILLHDEVQLIDWGESRGTGPWVKLRLPDTDNLELFRGLDTATAKHTGHIFNITLSQGDIIPAGNPDTPQIDSKQIVQQSSYGKEAQQLAKSSFFRTPKVWEAVGTQEQFTEWVQKQRCIICNGADLIERIGEERCEAAHVRRASESGTSYKADYALVPMCNSHHNIQHNHGETRAYRAYMERKTGREQQVTLDQAKGWFDKMRIQTVFNWCWEAVKKELGYDSWANVPPGDLHAWAINHGFLLEYLPQAYQLTED